MKCDQLYAYAYAYAFFTIFKDRGYLSSDFMRIRYLSPLPVLSLTLLLSQKILTLLVFWGLFRPQTLTDLPATNTYLTTYVGYINSKSIQPIINFGTIYALRGLKRPKKTVVRLRPFLLHWLCKVGFVASIEVKNPFKNQIIYT